MSSTELQRGPLAALAPVQSLASAPLSMHKAERTDEPSTTRPPEPGLGGKDQGSQFSSLFTEFTTQGSNTAFKLQPTLDALCELCKADFILEIGSGEP